MAAPEETAAPRRQLSLFDCTCIIVGIIIGSGIYRTSPDIAAHLPSAAMLIGVWLLGGMFALIGSLCYAELASTYPREGGDYVFLSRAYGSFWGMLFAWTEFWVIRPGSIGAMTYVFAQYAHELWPLAASETASQLIYAASSVIVTTGVNVVGVRTGAWTQNLLTAVKVAGLLAVFATAVWFFAPTTPEAAPLVAESQPLDWGSFRFAMIMVMFTYGGWNDISYVAAEVQRPERNVLRALLIGTTTVVAIYVLTNIAFVLGLGFRGVQNSPAVAAELLARPFGPAGAKAISLLICLSALGAINGMILTSARIYYALGKDHRLFAFLGHWNERLGTPVRALLAQGLVTLALVLAVGTENGFERTVTVAAPFFWFFFLMVAVSVFVLRWREPEVPRVYRVHPVTPLLFCASTAFMLHASTTYAYSTGYREGYAALAVVVVGVLIGLVFRRRRIEAIVAPGGTSPPES